MDSSIWYWKREERDKKGQYIYIERDNFYLMALKIMKLK